MKLRVRAWIGPRGVAALAALAVVAGGLSALAPEILRTVPPQLVLARPDAIRYDVRNRGSGALRFAIFEPPAARLAVDVSPARGRIARNGRATVTIPVVARERGRTHVGEAFAWYESPLGFVRRRMAFGVTTPLRVRPDLSALETGADLARRTHLIDAGLRRIRRRGIGSEFESLREYSAGDPYRAIDWKATARRGKVMVAQHEVERSQQIVVAIDAGRLMAPRLGDRRKLDYAVSAALAIAALAGRAADRVGLLAFAGQTLTAIEARAGRAHTLVLGDALSDLEPHLEESDYERAALELRRRYAKRSLIVVFTDFFDPVASSAVLASLAALAPPHLVLVVLMNDAAIADALDRRPATAAQAYRATVATVLAEQRARAVASLRARGIGVIDVPARELTLALLDAYVDIKSRALL